MENQEKEKYFQPFLHALLATLLDRNKRVQEAACSAFAELEGKCCTDLVPHLGVILESLVNAFRKYQVITTVAIPTPDDHRQKICSFCMTQSKLWLTLLVMS